MDGVHPPVQLAEPEKVVGLSVSPGFLGTLSVEPALGRGFSLSDENPDREPAVILSDGCWKSRFGGDRSVLGRRMLLDGTAYSVVGVLPPSFEFMDSQISLLAPIRFRRADIRVISLCCQGVARLKPGVTLAQANAHAAHGR